MLGHLAVADHNGAMTTQAESPETASEGRRPKARELNDTIRYTMWSVFQVTEHGARSPTVGSVGLAAEVVPSWRTGSPLTTS